jgi:hypothetical protein
MDDADSQLTSRLPAETGVAALVPEGRAFLFQGLEPNTEYFDNPVDTYWAGEHFGNMSGRSTSDIYLMDDRACAPFRGCWPRRWWSPRPDGSLPL